jgi:hypothetical protein
MKTLFLSMVAVALSFGAFAQDSTLSQTPPTEQQQTQQKDMYVFKDGKVWEVKNGKTSELTKDATLANGTVVKTTGEVVTKDGQSSALKDGQYIDVDGNIGQTASGQ